MSWFILADRLKTPLQELQAKTSSSEFVEWMHYIDKEVNAFHREDYYLAQIAYFICKVNEGKKSRFKLKDFLLKFGDNRKKEMSKEEATKQHKNFWMSVVGATQLLRKKKHGNRTGLRKPRSTSKS